MTAPEQVGPRLVERIKERGDEVAAALRSCDLAGPTELPGWDRLTVACHLRYGAETLAVMTPEVIAGRPASYYPGRRELQRPGTLVPRAGESPLQVVDAMAAAADALVDSWRLLDAAAWSMPWVEPDDNPDFGPGTLASLAMSRLTELEVHGTDLGLGLSPWSDLFVEAALPFRVGRLWGRRPAGDAEGTWHLRVTGDRDARWRVSRLGDAVEVEQATSGPRAGDAVIEAAAPDLLALLLGRPSPGAISLGGDLTLAAAFGEVFPGP